MRDRNSGQNLLVWDVGEQGLLRRLQSFCPAELVGDDGAVLTPSPGRSLIVTSDVLVDGVHFSDRTTRPEDAGWRAVAANLSDLAAMGASPLGITVGLAVPGTVPVTWIERLYQGMVDCLQTYGTAIVGGDVVRSPVTTVAITAFGEADPTRIIRRSAARPGDAILVTGIHGASRAGLELLLHPELGQGLEPSDRAALIQSHQRPNPRLDVLPILWQVWGAGGMSRSTLPSPPFPTPHLAGMDSSDGLADAIVQICMASGVGARVERSQIPLPPALVAWVGADKALDWALYGGEDFELVLCLPLEVAQRLVSTLTGATIVGVITAEPGIVLVDADKNHAEMPLSLEQGFQHFESTFER
ncbi:thiamine-phosphate kinase [Leptothermofonsia sp. ETS-13]|uniref:thiamine-phosphate kinase n=1 Tax=Leptothermofonsia sp. ETS-13 TaxID=3035696 RepID=UPI003BA248BA